MSLSIDPGMRSLLMHKTHRLATCWKITRTDGTVFRFTSHDTELVLSDSQTYTPVGGLNESAHRKESGLREQAKEYNGVISSSAITYEDLRGGKWREAAIVEYLVDWRYPWAGSFYENHFWIDDTNFDGEMWKADVVGLGRLLKPKIGGVCSRTCEYDFGDTNCGVSKATHTYSPLSVSTVLDSRLSFEVSGLIGVFGDDYFNLGYVEFSSGNNDGLVGEVLDYDESDRQIDLILPMPYDIQLTDTLSLVAGCDKQKTTCVTKFSNGINFGAEPYVPGTDQLFKGIAK